MAGTRVEVINSKGCSTLFALKNLKTSGLMSQASSGLTAPRDLLAAGPFTGLVICVTGLSKEARKQVMAATERLGGQYSGSLHSQCTHLVVQSFGGSKFEHALKHGLRNGLLLVTLGWFIDSVRRNVRLSESLYSVRTVGQSGLPPRELYRLVGLAGTEKSCLPVKGFEDERTSKAYCHPYLQSPREEFKSDAPILSSNCLYIDSNVSSEIKKKSPREEFKSDAPILSSNCLYIDSNVSSEIKKKVVEAASGEGATFLEHWFIGCHANYVICEGSSVQRYIGHTKGVVTPLWILKSVKEKCLQRLVHLSSDLARQVAMILENAEDTCGGGGAYPVSLNSRKPLEHKETQEKLEEKQKIVELAKLGVRSRRCRRMQLSQSPISQITPSSLLDSICWSISEPTSTANTYTEDSTEHPRTSIFFDARDDGRDSEVSFNNLSRPLKESEKGEVIFKNNFLAILFPIDRFGELGPSSRVYFSEGGFTCLQVLDHLYNFYQENMSMEEIEVAIHSDSRHADRLRSLYASKESIEEGFVCFKRIDFLGSRRSFEALKRVSGENNGNVYELLIRA